MLLSTVIYVLYITLSLPTLYFTVYYVCFIVRQSFFLRNKLSFYQLDRVTRRMTCEHFLWNTQSIFFFFFTFSDFSGLSRWSAYSHCLVTALKSTHSITCNFLFRVFFCLCSFVFVDFISFAFVRLKNYIQKIIFFNERKVAKLSEKCLLLENSIELEQLRVKRCSFLRLLFQRWRS